MKESDGNPHILGPATPGEELRYGEKPTSQALAEVIQHVRINYRFRNVAELNAILREFNVIARTGRPGTRLYDNNGIVYQATDSNWRGKGVPIKASRLEFKPTLAALRVNFDQYQTPDLPAKDRAEVQLIIALREGRKGSRQWKDALRRAKLSVAPETDPLGKTIGLLLVDWASKTVIRGDELGEEYDWESMKNKLGYDPLSRQAAINNKIEVPQIKQSKGRRIGG